MSAWQRFGGRRGMYHPDADGPAPADEASRRALSGVVTLVVKHGRVAWAIGGACATALVFLAGFLSVPRRVEANTLRILAVEHRMDLFERGEARRDIFLCTLLEADPKTHRPECTAILSLTGH